MYGNKYWLCAALLIVFVLNSGLQCNKRIGCADAVYNFEIGIKAYPDEENIRIGDTIWLEVNEPTTLKDVSTGRTIDYSNATNLGSAISFAKLIAVGSTENQIASEFSYAAVIGKEVYRPDTIMYREYTFREASGNYKFKLAIVPKAKGVFKMFVSNAANVYRKDDRCTKANFKNTDQHLHLNKVSFPDSDLPAGAGVYLFRVE